MRTFIKRVFKCEYYQIGENEKKHKLYLSLCIYY